MILPDDEFDEDAGYASDDDEEIDTGDLEAMIWNLLVLINPGDEESALRQFSLWRDGMAEAQGDESQALPVLKDAIDWSAGFYVDWNDTESLVDSVEELVARWNLSIDWGGDTSDDDFLDATDVPALMAVAYDRLREYGYTLWNWNTDGDAYAGWIALSRDDEAMQHLCTALGIEIRPGSDAF
jgi:hypothetical protein